jgi:hypothetical protein
VLAAERKSGLGDSLDVPTLLEVLRSQAAAAKSNDLAQAEAMLMNQATALQTLFGRLAERGMGCDQALAFEANLRIALRAQSQCRATLETLAMIKNPAPVAFVRQANIAAGPQQVNNGPAPVEPARARETENQQTKLLEAQNERLDTRATSTAGAADPALETVGAIDRTEDAGG